MVTSAHAQHHAARSSMFLTCHLQQCQWMMIPLIQRNKTESTGQLVNSTRQISMDSEIKVLLSLLCH